MKNAFRVGFSFGLPSGIVTTLGLMVGLYSSTQSKFIVIGGILTIALTDSLSDAMGMHFSKESENNLSHMDIWEVTYFTLLAKFIFSIIFIIPILIFPLNNAIIMSVVIGAYLIFAISLILARERGDNPWIVISSHLIITFVVIILAHFLGIFISNTFRCNLI
jgi:vacuolar iron transporter family protein